MARLEAGFAPRQPMDCHLREARAVEGRKNVLTVGGS
jgi:hypothetical protein